jgi:hypothetical protein
LTGLRVTTPAAGVSNGSGKVIEALDRQLQFENDPIGEDFRFDDARMIRNQPTDRGVDGIWHGEVDGNALNLLFRGQCLEHGAGSGAIRRDQPACAKLGPAEVSGYDDHDVTDS